MPGTDRVDTKFGEDPADSESLLRTWNETRPEPAGHDWHAFWESTCRKAGPLETATPRGGSWLRPALAASLLICLSIAAWRSNRSQPVTNVIANRSLPHASTEADSSTQVAAVSIDLGEIDSLPIIRVGYADCPMPSPCVESVETYSSNGTDATALASNFQLLNDFESIATE